MDKLVAYLVSSNAAFAEAYAAYPGLIWLLLWVAYGSAVMMAFITPYAMLVIWAERKVAGHIQARCGPNRVGPFGLLQSIADGLKLLLKEDVIPTSANKFLFMFAPMIVFVGTFIPFVVLPFSRDIVGTHMNIGIFFISSFMALEVIGVIMAGWASNSKWSLYGAMRLASQMMSYEIPLGLSLACVAIYVGSLDIHVIVESQSAWMVGWNVVQSPFLAVAFVIYYVAALASAKRAPFDLPEAESELVSGFHTEYTGMRFSFFFLAEYAAMYVLAAVGAILFLGGWHAPIPVFWIDLLFKEGGLFASTGLFGPGMFVNELLKNGIWASNLALKSFVLIFLMLQLRWTLPRLRIDQVMTLGWKVLTPFALVCLVGAAVQGIAMELIFGH